ncbi:MAG: cytochrome c [Wenzhouxiangellaceae bacterium]
MKLFSQRFVLVLVIMSVSLSAIPARADTSTIGVIEYRQSIMSAIAGHFGASRRLLDGDYQAEGELAFHARSLAHLMRDVSHYFPSGSTHEDSEAEPTIWEQWSEFKQLSDDAATASAQFATAAENDDPTAANQAFDQIKDACRGCHKQFRQ